MNRIDERTQRENRRLIAVYLKNADKYLKAREFERAAEEVDRALALEATNEYVQAYKERILELRHASVKQAANHKETVRVYREPLKKKKEETRERVVQRKHHDAASEKQREEEEVLSFGEFEKRIAEEKIRKRRDNGEEKWVEELVREKTNEEQINTYLREAEEFLRQEQFDKARLSAEKAFALDPRDPRAPILYTKIREGILSARQRKVEEDAKREEIQKRVQIHIERVRNYLETGKLERALDEVGEASSIDPTNAELNRLSERVREAIESRQRAREEEARRRLEEEARQRREAEERRRLEEEARRQAEEEARRRALQERIAELLQNAQEHLEREKFKKALDEVENVFKLSPQNMEAIQLREVILLREEEKRRAEEEARRRAEEEARRRKEEEERLKLERKIFAFIQSAETFFVKGRYEKALSELNNAYVLDPENAEVRRFVEKIEQAIEVQRRAEQAEKLRREEEARRRFEEEALRKREQEEQRRRQEEERQRAEAEAKRQARLLRVHGYLAKALEELTTVRAVDPLNTNVTQLENALREAFEKADKAFPPEEMRVPLAPDREERRGEFQTRQERPPVRPAGRSIREAGITAPLSVRETIPRARRAARLLKSRIAWRKFVVPGVVIFVVAIASLLLSRQLGLFSERKALLVMPLQFIPEGSSESYLGDAMMTRIVSDFSAVPGLAVFNEATAFALRQSGDAMSAAKRVDATHVLAGTIKREGGRLVVSIKLNEALTGKSIWGKEFSASPQDFVLVRNSIFDGVLDALDVDATAAKPSARGFTNDPVALDSYWKGRAELLGSGEENFHRAIKDFDQALARDNRFALALAGKAAAALSLYKRDPKSDPRWLSQAEEFSSQALQINDEISLAHRTLGSALVYGRNYERGMKEIQRALALEPSDASAYRAIALVYAGMGDHKNSTVASETALSLDPLNFESFIVLGLVNHCMGNYAEASAAYEQAIAFEPGAALGIIGLLDNALLAQGSHRRALSLYQTFLHLHPDDFEVLYKVGRAYQMDGQIQVAQPYFDQVIDLAQRELRRDPKSARAYIYMALAQTRTGKYSQARSSAKRAIEIAPKEPIALYGMACMFSMQNESGAALDWLRKAVATRFSYQHILDVDLLNARSDLPFSEIIRANG